MMFVFRKHEISPLPFMKTRAIGFIRFLSPSLDSRNRCSGKLQVAMAILLLASAPPVLGEGGREFQQNRQITLPFVDSFDSKEALGKFPPGWDGAYLDDDHNFLVSNGLAVTEPNALQLFSRGPAANGMAPMLYVIVPKSDSLWLTFDFYFDPKDNYFRAGLGDSGAMEFGITGTDKRFFAIDRQDGHEVLSPIPSEYFRPGEWNRISIGREPDTGSIRINGQVIKIPTSGTPLMSHIKFIIGSAKEGSASLFIDNVSIDRVPPGE